MRKSEYDHIEREIAKRRATSQPPLARVNPIFTQKPYSAANDLRKILKNKKRKASDKERHHKYYEAHKEEQAEKLKVWRDENRDQLHEQQKRYREKHADELRKRRQEYYLEHKEKIKAKSREYYYKRKGQENEQGRSAERSSDTVEG